MRASSLDSEETKAPIRLDDRGLSSGINDGPFDESVAETEWYVVVGQGFESDHR